jgi:hypothetical protein
MVRSFARAGAIISSLLLMATYVWYRGGGLQAAPPAQDVPQAAPAAQAPNDEPEVARPGTPANAVANPAPTFVVAARPDASGIVVAKNVPPKLELGEHFPGSKAEIMFPPRKGFVFVPSPAPPVSPKVLMSDSKDTVPSISTNDFERTIERLRSGPIPSEVQVPTRREIMGGSKSKTVVDLNEKEVEALKIQLSRIQQQIAILEGRGGTAKAAPAASPAPAPITRREIMYSSKSGAVFPPPAQSRGQTQAVEQQRAVQQGK